LKKVSPVICVFLLAGLFLDVQRCFAQSGGGPQISLVQVASGLNRPVHITNANDGSGRIFVTEQAGTIRVVKDGYVLEAPFLDITDRVGCCGERGLLSVAFPPGYSGKGYFYVDYTDKQGNTVVARYRTTSQPDIADAASEETILKIGQPFPNHNGGQLDFGPEGYLYIGMGDGGSGGDPMDNAQNTLSLLGKILRVDVESGTAPYDVPPSNPFVTTPGYRPEIWALGLRNPWRFSFDPLTGDLWIGDVGQNYYEEIDRQPASSRGGENYGWNVMEGFHCYTNIFCNRAGLTLPVLEYSHQRGDCSVTGGRVYRGEFYPRLQALYLYADYCSGRIWGLAGGGASLQTTLLMDTPYQISTFGNDEQGNVYTADLSGGGVYKIVDAVALMPVPSRGLVFERPLEFAPKVDPDPTIADPLGVGLLAAGGSTLSLRIGLARFGGPVDVYFGVSAPSVDPVNLYLLRQDNTLHSVAEGVVPWREATEGPIDEALFGDIQTTSLPLGIYNLYLLVTPSGSLESFYLWSAAFSVP